MSAPRALDREQGKLRRPQAGRRAASRGLALLVLGLALRAMAGPLATPSPPVPSAGEEVLLVLYRDKPPYSYTEGGQPRGLLIAQTRLVLEAAGIPFRLEEAPLKRIQRVLQADEQAVCSPGWYRLPERERYARFSRPMSQDPPQGVLVGRHALDAVQAHASLATLMADRRLRMAVSDGISYGPQLDELIRRRQPPPERATVTPAQLARMLAAGRADYMFIDRYDYEWLNQHGELGSGAVSLQSFPDLPPGLQRHMLCSRQVDVRRMKAMDAAIQRLGLPAPLPAP